MESFAITLVGYTALTRLLLDNNKLGDMGAKHLAGALPTMQLQELNIGFNGIEAEGLTEVINAIYSNPTLQVLILSGNSITNSVSKVIANMLLHNYNLRHLYLDHTNIGPVGEKYIAAGIATNKRSGVRLLTGFQLGKVLASLGSPPHLSTLSNEATLTYLSLMWEAHNLAASLNTPSDSTKSIGDVNRMVQSGSEKLHSDTDMNRNSSSAQSVSSYNSNNCESQSSVDCKSGPLFHASSSSRAVSASDCAGTHGQEQVPFLPSTNNRAVEAEHSSVEKSPSSSGLTQEQYVQISERVHIPVDEVIAFSENRISSSKSLYKLASKSKDFGSFPFLSKLNDKLAMSDKNNIDAILSYSEQEIVRRDSCHVDLESMSIGIGSRSTLVENRNSVQDKGTNIEANTAG